MTTIETMYWLPYCTTCQKAEKHLLDGGAKIKRYVNVKEEPVGKEILRKLAEGVGGIEKLFSRRAMKYRQWGLNERNLSDAEMLDYMHEEYTFITRPVIVTATGDVLSGYSKKRYDVLLGN